MYYDRTEFAPEGAWLQYGTTELFNVMKMYIFYWIVFHRSMSVKSHWSYIY